MILDVDLMVKKVIQNTNEAKIKVKVNVKIHFINMDIKKIIYGTLARVFSCATKGVKLMSIKIIELA